MIALNISGSGKSLTGSNYDTGYKYIIFKKCQKIDWQTGVMLFKKTDPLQDIQYIFGKSKKNLPHQPLMVYEFLKVQKSDSHYLLYNV